MDKTGRGPGPQSKASSVDIAGPPWGPCTCAQEAVSGRPVSTPRLPWPGGERAAREHFQLGPPGGWRP